MNKEKIMNLADAYATEVAHTPQMPTPLERKLAIVRIGVARAALEAALEQPVQRPWVGLTEDEIKGTWAQLWYDLTHGKLSTPDNEVRNNVVMFGQALEAKLKEKNNG